MASAVAAHHSSRTRPGFARSGTCGQVRIEASLRPNAAKRQRSPMAAPPQRQKEKSEKRFPTSLSKPKRPVSEEDVMLGPLAPGLPRATVGEITGSLKNVVEGAYAASQLSKGATISAGSQATVDILAAFKMKPFWVIDPRTSSFVGYWDATVGLALVYTAFVTPVEVGFLPPFSSPSNPLFIINQIILGLFLIDFALQFLLMYPQNDGREGSRWISQPKKIVIHYLRTWFPLDITCILVSVFDYISLMPKEPGQSSNLESLKVLRTLRALRLIKLIRLMRASRMAKHWEVRVSVNYSLLAMSKCVFGMILLSHFFACVWGLQTSFSPRIEDTWVFDDGYCRTKAADAADAGVDSSGYGAHIECDPPQVLYAASIYWAVMTITSIGYGDITATPRNEVELFICSFLMLLGSMLWAQVLATFVSLLSTMNIEVVEFRQMMDSLNSFMSRHRMPHEMRRRLREYFHQTQHLRIAARQKELIDFMSPSLQSEVAWTCNKQWLQRIWFLNEAPVKFLVSLAKSLTAFVFAPGELAPLGYMYIINRGLALYAGKLLGAGKVWGSDVILRSEYLRYEYCARAMNYLEVFAINREDLEIVSDRFPAMARIIRREAVRLATRRAFILEAKRRGMLRDAVVAPNIDPTDENGRPQLFTQANVFDQMLVNASMVNSEDQQDGEDPRVATERSLGFQASSRNEEEDPASQYAAIGVPSVTRKVARAISNKFGAAAAASQMAAAVDPQLGKLQSAVQSLAARQAESERKIDALLEGVQTLLANSNLPAARVKAAVPIKPDVEVEDDESMGMSAVQALTSPLSSWRAWRSGRIESSTAAASAE